MLLIHLFENINDKIFFRGFEKDKVINDGAYKLAARPGWIYSHNKNKSKSDQFRIIAKDIKGNEIGWVNFEKHDDHLEALDLVIQPAHRNKGIASEMYKFARELGNDIAPSKLQTTMGKQFWSKIDHSNGMRKDIT